MYIEENKKWMSQVMDNDATVVVDQAIMNTTRPCTVLMATGFAIHYGMKVHSNINQCLSI